MNSPFVLAIFGATGDLAYHKLIPALFALFKEQKLPKDFFIVGFARRPLSNKEFSASFTLLQEDPKWKAFVSHLAYQQGTFEETEGYLRLIDQLQSFDKKVGACITRIFYLATPPQNYELILQFLEKTKLSEGCGQGSSKWTRIAIEKPFGKDLETARKLDQKLSQIFDEKQIFRVDHYLGKETVQNMLVFRFANGIFDPIWNNQYIDHVQITFAEEKGIGARGKFYDGVGELRDIGQNHLLQLLTAVAMEMPKNFSKDGVRDARAAAIKALRCPEISHVVRGQYDSYKIEKDVPENSITETFIAMKTFVETPRFMGMPFYIRAGKKLAKNSVSISLVFKQTCHILFKEIGCPEEGNILTFHIQPNEGISLKTIAKGLGEKISLNPVNMHFTYEESYKSKGHDAYQKVLNDIISGDQMLFNRSDELDSSWEFITEILKKWETGTAPLPQYKAGSWGPKSSDNLIEKDGRKWIDK